MPKVSVILPNYNHSRYLTQRIESILNQTYQDFELIILDDKSPDDSVSVIERYRDHERVSQVVINENNSGSTFKQWDLGFSLAQGEYIWIAESDDYADETFLEKCVAALDAHPTVGFCMTDSHCVDSEGEIVNYKVINRIELKDRSSSNKPIKYNGKELVKQKLIKYNIAYNASMILFRKAVLSSIPVDYKGYKACGDWLFWGEIALRHDVARVPERLNYFRQHNNKVSAKSKQSGLGSIEPCEVMADLIERYANNCNAESFLGKASLFRTKIRTIKRIWLSLDKYIGITGADCDFERIEMLKKRMKRIHPWYSRRLLLRFIM
ncbi:MAG: glycosyltransferase family 2 protein [Rikenellaceae bacterium]